MILLDPERTFEVKYKDVKFTCKPIIASDMAKFMDMSAVFDDEGNAQVKVNERNVKVCRKYIVSADGLEVKKGKKLPWRSELVDRLPIDVINFVANEIIRRSAPDEEDEKNS